jgi:hypothetical protein
MRTTRPRARGALLAAALAAASARPALAADPAVPPASDGAAAIGRLGAGFYGLQAFDLSVAGAAPNNVVPVATLGARYWLPGVGGGFAKAVGVDLGVGLGFGGGSRTAGNVTTDAPSISAVGLHVGLPLALAQWQHATFEVVPELSFVHAASTVRAAGAPDISLAGNGFDLGARVGLEIFFGFIGVPQLAIETTLGVGFAYTRASASQRGTPDFRTSSYFFGTTTFNDPFSYKPSYGPLSVGSGWAARYYF